MNATVTESIDSRILQLLGLEDTFDLDYDTYTQLLKERLVRVTIGKDKDKISDKDFDLLRKELKRVKVKPKNKKFKIEKEKLLNKKKTPATAKISTNKLLLPGKGGFLSIYKQVQKKSKELQYLKAEQKEKEPKNLLPKIDERLSSILESLIAIGKSENKSFEINRREREKKKREDKESSLEKGKKLIGGAVQKILAPFQNIFDRIWKFITFTLLGRAFTMLMNWFGDPKNKKKVETLGRFLKDWWPALLFGVVAFTNPFGKLVRGVLGTVIKWTFKVSKFVIPKLLNLVKSPAGMGLALFTAGAWVPQLFPQTVNEQERKTDKAPGSKEDKIKTLEKQKANLNLFEKLQGKGSEIDEQIEYLKTGKTKSYGFYSGGFVSGETGIDKVPAMLSDGEFVMSRGAVQKFGIPFLESLNAAGGGTNKPKVIRGVPHAYGGGPIGNYPNNSTGVDAVKKAIMHILGIDVDNPKTWGPKSPESLGNQGRGGGGIAGTISRRIQYEFNKRFGGNSLPSNEEDNSPIPSKGGGISGTVARRLQYEYNKRFSGKKPPSNKPSSSRTSEGYGSDKSDVFGGLKRSTYRDAGKVFLKSLTGVGGSITEKDLSPESQRLLQQAIQRAESRQSQKIRKAQTELSKDPNNPEKRSALKRLLAGQIRLEYGDYASKIQVGPDGKYKPIFTEAEDDLKNILGQAWFKKQMGGGYRSTNEKYDFQKYEAPLAMLAGITAFENKDVKKSGANFQKRLEAIHQIASDPASIFGRQFAEMVKPYKDTPVGKMLGISGIAKDLDVDVMLGGKRPGDNPRNIKALESKRPWWDKMGWFGGASARTKEEQSKKQEFLKRNPGARLYNKPQVNTGQPYKSRFARPARGKTGVTNKPGGWNPFGWITQRRQGGGLIGESTGLDYSMSASDRQILPINGMNMTAALEPGEYVLPKGFVQKIGAHNIDRAVGEYDRDSTAAKLGYREIKTPKITPYSPSAKSKTIMLPPTVSSSRSYNGSILGSGSEVPDFSAIPAQGVETRMMAASIYGLVTQ